MAKHRGGMVSDEILMQFMNDIRTKVESIQESVALQGAEIAAVKENQKNTPKTNALWATIGALIGLLISLLISYQQIKSEYVRDKQTKEQRAVPRGYES